MDDRNRQPKIKITTVLNCIGLFFILLWHIPPVYAYGTIDLGTSALVSSGGAQSTATGNGRIYLTFYDSGVGGYDIFFCISDDFGKTWQPCSAITGTGAGFDVYPSIAANNNNMVCVTWERGAGMPNSYVYLRCSTNGGTTWQDEKRIDNSTVGSGFPSVAVDDSGYVYVTWHDMWNVYPANIYVSVSNDNGQTFDTHRLVSGSVGGSISHIATDGGGNVYVVFSATRAYRQFYFTKSSDHGASWSTPRGDLGDLGLPSIYGPQNDDWWLVPSLEAQGDNVYLAWPKHLGSDRWDVYFRKSSDRGATFGSPIMLYHPNSETGTGTSIAIDGKFVYAGWSNKQVNYDRWLAISVDGGQTFGQALKIIDDRGDLDTHFSNKGTIQARNDQVNFVWTEYDIPGHVVWPAYIRSATPDKYRFGVMADSRGNSNTDDGCVNKPVLRNIFGRIIGLNPQPEFILFGGDMIQGLHSYNQVNTELGIWRDTIEQPSGTYPGMGSDYVKHHILPAFGTHERNRIGYCSNDSNRWCRQNSDCLSGGTCVIENTNAWKAFRDFFDPAQNIPIGVPGTTCNYLNTTYFGRTAYYCDYKNARFYVLNNDCIQDGTGTADNYNCISHEIGTTQYNWLNLASKPLNFFIHHEPAYGTGAHEAEDPPYAMDQKKPQRNEYIELLGNDNATMIFSGHEHQYTRRLINQEFANLPINEGGTIVILAAPKNSNIGPRTAESYDGATADHSDSTLAPLLHIEYTDSSHITRTLEARVASSSDDAEESSTGTVTLNSTDLELMKDGTNIQRYVGMRWTGIHIPQGATITNAYIEFTVDETGSNPAAVRFYGEAADFAQTFAIANNNLSNRSRTAAYVDWDSIDSWNTIGVEKRTPQTSNLSSIIQQIVARPGWGGVSFSGEFYEVKTGTAGAPPHTRENPLYLRNLIEKVNSRHHYAVMDVIGDHVILNVYDKDGIPIDQPPLTGGSTVNVPTATGVGQMTVDLPGFTMSDVKNTLDTDPSLDQQTKPNREFPFGLLKMDITGINPGATVTVTLTFPSNIPTNYEYWKYNTSQGWYQIPFGSNNGDNVITITLTDGGTGDGDGVANGVIADFGGFGKFPEIINTFVTFDPITSTYKTTSDTSGCPSGFVGKFSFDAKLTNISDDTLTNLMAKVTTLTNGNLLQNADFGPGGVGSVMTVPKKNDYVDGILSPKSATKPAEYVDVPFVICLKQKKPFQFFVDVLGIAE